VTSRNADHRPFRRSWRTRRRLRPFIPVCLTLIHVLTSACETGVGQRAGPASRSSSAGRCRERTKLRAQTSRPTRRLIRVLSRSKSASTHRSYSAPRARTRWTSPAQISLTW
jgi:hypothetical protein